MAIQFLNTVQVDTDVLYVDTANDRVGIGTTSPGAKLSVKSSGTNNWVFRATSSDGGDLGGIYEDGGTNAELYIKDSVGTSSVVINSSGDSWFNGGNVGIGTTSPSEKLEVNGNIKFTSNGNQLRNSAGNNILNDTSNLITIGNGATSTVYARGNVGIGTASPTALLTLESSGSTPYPGIDIKSTSTYPGSKIRFLNTSGSEVSTIESWSNPSISYLKLHYGGTASFSSTLTLDDGFLYLSTADSERMRITNTGNVGIGTASPGAKLDVVQATTANGAAALHLIGPSSNPGLTTSVLIIEQSDGKKITMDGNDIDVSSGDLFINDYSGEDVTFGGQIKVKGLGNPVGDSYISNGNFGVGTTSPQEKLHVVEEVEGNTLIEVENTRGNSTAGIKLSSGSTNFNIAYTDSDGNFQIYNRATNRIEFHIGANGRVGIDTTNPAVGTKLDVAGSVKAEKYINQRVAWNVGFNHGSNNAASYYFIPVGYLAETTSDTYYNNWIAPYAGRVRKIVMRNTGTSTVPTATTVNFRVSVNGSVVYTGSTITVTGSGLNILASQTLSDTNAVFSATDRVQVAYRTNGLWRNAATGISLEYTE